LERRCAPVYLDQERSHAPSVLLGAAEFGGPKMGKQRSTDSAQKRKGIVKDLDREDSRDKVPEDGSFRRAFESARTLAQKALERIRSKAVHPPEKK
jgi:hypothetical protein